MPKAIHFHYNSTNNVNVGDEAHVLAIQETLQARIKNLDIQEFPISFLCHYQLPQTIPGAKYMPLFIQNAARSLRGTSYQSLIKKVNQSDLVIIGGGGVYMDHLLPFNIPLLRQFTAPIVIFGAGYNQNTSAADFSKRQLESIVALGTKAHLHSVRDNNTVDFLKRLGVHATLIGDPAVFLKKASVKDLPTKKEGTLAIGINIAAHGWKQQGMYVDRLIDAYTAMMRLLQRQHSVEFYYFMHHPNERSVITKMLEKGIIFKAVVNKKARETKAMYSVMDATISMMLHSTILAYGEGVPAICVGYDMKNASFMELTGQKDRHIPVALADTETLHKQAQKLLKNLPEAKQQISANLQRMQPVYTKFTDGVGALVS